MTPLSVNVTAPGTPLRWLLYACTYNEVASLSIGVVDGSSIGPDDPYIPRSLNSAPGDARNAVQPTTGDASSAPADAPAGSAPAPIVWYGTSIL